MQTNLEDHPEDILTKAQQGLGMSDEELLSRSGVEPSMLAAVRQGHFDAEAIRRLAPILGLDPTSLVAIGEQRWQPEILQLPGLHRIESPYRSSHVNAYLIGDTFAGKAILFDTGTNVDAVITQLRAQHWELDAIFLTHTDPDHIAALEAISKATGTPTLYAPPAELLVNALPCEEGQKFRLGRIELYPLSTPGHSPGGTSFLVEGLARPVIICGDALFAGSIGRVTQEHYTHALAMVREKLLSQHPLTILCPGHGPLTTVADERQNNPFFAENPT